MTAVELNHRKRKLDNFSQIQLNAEDERCGEIFITLSRTLIFHCSICAINFGSYDYFLDHLSTEHFEDVLGEVIEIDAQSEQTSMEALFEGYSFDKEYDEDSIKDEIDEDIDDDDDVDNDDCEYEEILQKVEVNLSPKFGQIEEVFLEEPHSSSRAYSEHTFEGFEELNAGQTKEEMENEEQTLCSQFLDEQTSDTKINKPTRRKTTKTFSCEECGKVFKTHPKLRRHYVTHSDERNHQCKICGFAFKERSNLDAHMRRHTGIKTINCGYCPKKFFTTSEAKNHRRTHTGERPYVCPICGMGFSNGGGLSVHVRKHNSDPDYNCEYCGKGFYGKAEYNDHLVVHTKEKPFACQICAARFPRYKSMIRHTKMHDRPKT